MTDITNLRDTITPKSDQINAEQLLGAPLTITVTGVRRGSTAEQPVSIDHDADPSRPYKPCKTMRKVLVALWGEDGHRWIGQSMVLFCDPEVKWGGVMVGGIRISHMTGIDRDVTLSLTETKGRKQAHLIKRLAIERRDDPAEQARADLTLAADNGLEALKTAWAALPGRVQRAIGGAPALADLKARAEAEVAKRKAIDHPAETNAPALDALNAAAAQA